MNIGYTNQIAKNNQRKNKVGLMNQAPTTNQAPTMNQALTFIAPLFPVYH
jgi:hypothetical protein